MKRHLDADQYKLYELDLAAVRGVRR